MTAPNTLTRSPVRGQTGRARPREEIAELLRSEALHRRLTEMSSDLVAILAPDGTLLYQSPAIEASTGFTPSELVGRKVFDLVHPDDVDRVRRAFEAGVRDAEVKVREVYRFRTRDGGWVWFESGGRNLIDDPVVGGVVVNTRDVTDRKALEERFYHAQKLEAVGRLAGGVAHDFNNLLTVIGAHAQILLDDLPAGSQWRESVEEIDTTARRAAALTRQLLAFSKRQVVQPRVVDLNELLTGVEKMLRRLIGEDVEIRLRLAPGEVRVLADPGQLEQVVLNLAVNARDAMPEGGVLSLETELRSAREGSSAVLRVSDTGVGIPPEVRGSIFDPFFTTKEGGTGLGLSTVHGIVSQSQGSIRVASDQGSGTTFEIRLPEAAGSGSTDAASEQGKAGGGSETILLVEDNAGVRAVAARILGAHGYTVLEARDAESARERAAAHEGPIHLLLTDVVLPGIDGRGLAKQFLAACRGSRVLYTSGYVGDASTRAAVVGSSGAFLPKPFTPSELLGRVRDTLEGAPVRRNGSRLPRPTGP